MDLKRVVVTGLGALTPIGNTLSEYWEGLVSGKSGADKIAVNTKVVFSYNRIIFNAYIVL